jgi:hypothetical protein
LIRPTLKAVQILKNYRISLDLGRPPRAMRGLSPLLTRPNALKIKE